MGFRGGGGDRSSGRGREGGRSSPGGRGRGFSKDGRGAGGGRAGGRGREGGRSSPGGRGRGFSKGGRGAPNREREGSQDTRPDSGGRGGGGRFSGGRGGGRSSPGGRGRGFSKGGRGASNREREGSQDTRAGAGGRGGRGGPGRGQKRKAPAPTDEFDSDSEEEREAPITKRQKQVKGKKVVANESAEDESGSEDMDGDEPRRLSSFPGMLDSDGEDDSAGGMGDWMNGDDEAVRSGSDDEGDSGNSDEDELPIEKASRLLDDQMAVDKAEASEEARQSLARDVREAKASLKLPVASKAAASDDEEVEEAAEGAARSGGDAGVGSGQLPPAALKERITDIVEVLSDFKTRRDSNLSRLDYMEQLATDLGEYFGCLRELVDMFLAMFSPAECVEFLEASDRPRPMVIRTNTLKTRRKDLAEALIKRGVTLEPVAAWSKVGLKVTESAVPIGATPEYLAGHYILQSAASMCPVMALDPQPNERVLDMSAAPGGKTSYICQLMRNTGTVLANDLKAQRQKATVANLHRLGVRNAVVCKGDGRTLPGLIGGCDRCLLDAPCSGLGVISRDPSVKIQRTRKDVLATAVLQKELLLAAIDCVNAGSTTGGVIVYSTCSVSLEENEQVVEYALHRRYVKLIPAGLDHGKPGFTRHQHRRFHPSMALTRRFYPHVHNMDGFFVAKFKKFANGIKKTPEEEAVEEAAEGNDGETREEREERKEQRKEKEVAAKRVQATVREVVDDNEDDDVSDSESEGEQEGAHANGMDVEESGSEEKAEPVKQQKVVKQPKAKKSPQVVKQVPGNVAAKKSQSPQAAQAKPFKKSPKTSKKKKGGGGRPARRPAR